VPGALEAGKRGFMRNIFSGPVDYAKSVKTPDGKFDPGAYWSAFDSRPGSSYEPNIARASFEAARMAGMGGPKPRAGNAPGLWSSAKNFVTGGGLGGMAVRALTGSTNTRSTASRGSYGGKTTATDSRGGRSSRSTGGSPAARDSGRRTGLSPADPNYSGREW
jgi:hypothetical protein